MNRSDWNWETGAKEIADIKAITNRFSRVDEFTVSPDGEKIAAPVQTESGFNAIVNNEIWPEEVELLWNLRWTPEGKLLALVKINDEWTASIDGNPWTERFEYVWDPKFSGNGRSIGLLCKRDNRYGVVVDDQLRGQSYPSIRNYCLNFQGDIVAATVQVTQLKSADIFGFLKGTWSVAVNGASWNEKFLNTWNPCISADGMTVAAESRSGTMDYNIAVNGKVWDEKFTCVWKPAIRPQNGSTSIVAPVRKEGKWRMVENGKIIWDGLYNQLWEQEISPDGKKIAAVSSSVFGLWTIAVDDSPWPITFSDFVMKPVFSDDSMHVAAKIKDNNSWTIAVDGKVWQNTFDMIWDPIFSPDGNHVVTKADINGGYALVLDGRVCGGPVEQMWDPVFAPNGAKVLLRFIKDGKYIRQVMGFDELKG